MKQLTIRWMIVGVTAALVAVGVWLTVSLGMGSSAEASTRAATPAELALPPEVAALLQQEVGLVVGSPDAATISATIADTAARSASKTEYGTQLPVDAIPRLYLIQVGHNSEAGDPGLSVGSLKWLVVYKGLDIIAPGPVGADGQPTAGATIHSAVLIVDAETGTIDVTHWTSSII